MQSVDKLPPVWTIGIKDLYQDPFLQDWFENLSLITRKTYCAGLVKFCRHYWMTPEQIAQLPLDALKKSIRHYVSYLKKTARESAGKPIRGGKNSSNSIRTTLCGVQSFTESLEIPIVWRNIKKTYPKEQFSNEFRAYSKQEIKKMLLLADPRQRVLILLMATSGIRVGAIPQLTFKNVERLGAEHGGIAFIVVYGTSKKAKYLSVMTAEAVEALDSYKQQREDRGEKITDESPLIRDKSFQLVNSPVAIKKERIAKVMKDLLRKANLLSSEIQPDHSFRKFFNTSAKNAGIDNLFKEIFMGHSVKLDNVYYDIERPDSREKVITEYQKAVDLLTFSDEPRLRAKVKMLEREKNDMIRRISDRMDRIEQRQAVPDFPRMGTGEGQCQAIDKFAAKFELKELVDST